jgi:hypothetical protein
MESIFHLRHHPKSGFLHYRRVVPEKLRSIIGKGTITATLGSKVLDHDALIRWVEIDRDALRRLDNARRKLAGEITDDRVSPSDPVFIDIRKCVAAFGVWRDREIGRQSVRLYGLVGCDSDRGALKEFKFEIVKVRDGLAGTVGMNVMPEFDQQLVEALHTVGVSVPGDHVIMNALRPLFRESWKEVITVVEGLIQAVSGSALTTNAGVALMLSTGHQTTAPLPAPADSPRLSELAEAYLRHCEADDDYASDVRMYARRLGESLGDDRRVLDISKRDMIQFLAEISQLPARLTTSERGASLGEIISESISNRFINGLTVAAG